MGLLSHQPSTGTTASEDGSYDLKLLIKGFSAAERHLLSAIVKSSKIRRRPCIVLLDETDAEEADVVMIDSADEQAKNWALNQPWLNHKAVIWVGEEAAPGRQVLPRPVRWTYLPTLLTRALEKTTNNSVLVVDDSAAVRAQLRNMLESNGMAVIDVDNAEAAIKAAAVTHYGCILMDVLMPGIDGYEACRRIKEHTSGTHKPVVVMLTSKSSPFDRIRGAMAGCDAYLTKPVDYEKLISVISHYVTVTDEKSGAPPPPADGVLL